MDKNEMHNNHEDNYDMTIEEAKEVLAKRDEILEAAKLGALKEAQEQIDAIREDIKKSLTLEITEKQAKLEEWNQHLANKEIDLTKREAALIGAVEQKTDERTAVLRNALEKQISDIAEQKIQMQAKEDNLRIETEKLEAQRNSFNSRIEEEVQRYYENLVFEKEDLAQRLEEMKVKQKELITRYRDLKDVNDPKNLAGENQKLKKILQMYSEFGTPEEIENFVRKAQETDKLREEVYNLNKRFSQARVNALDVEKHREEAEILERINAGLTARINELQSEYELNKKVSREDMLSAFTTVPKILLKTSRLNNIRAEGELSWLDSIINSTEMEGIHYSKRHWTAFHTCLKVSEWSPLTILAGVSGTGKSEMPKRYAKHGGMNFISVPVKPEWDSPAALFGYYNTLENRFEATELTRVLYGMQRDENRSRMLLVLLDEMNLAHPEQYFADLLSRFEEIRENMNESAFVELSLGAGEPAEILNIGRNILWTGTMNEDETTKGLADKVIDRSSLITFPSPDELLSSKEIVNAETKEMMTVDLWNSWKNNGGTDNPELTAMIEDKRNAVNEINLCMRTVRRSVGHRVWRSIQNYIINYPYVRASVIKGENSEELTKYVNCAFEDAVVFKLMPKLRGLETGEGYIREQLNNIKNILNQSAPDIVPDFEETMKNDIFQWSSGNFLSKDF